jgi:hypothetical protein
MGITITITQVRIRFQTYLFEPDKREKNVFRFYPWEIIEFWIMHIFLANNCPIFSLDIIEICI